MDSRYQFPDLRYSLILLLFSGWVGALASPSQDLVSRLGTRVNLGNALDAPSEGAWGVRLENRYFELISEAGFDSIRLPVRWSAHASEKKPYVIEESFLSRVDWAIDQALRNDLAVALNMHHCMELFEEPEKHQERFLSLWSQIATRYKDLPSTVMFEPLNEPNTKLTPEKWNALIPQIVDVIRMTNPHRPLVLGVANWSNVEYTPQLILPSEDPHLILSFHYYSPHEFTHQGTPWSQPRYRNANGICWMGTEEEKQAITHDFMIAVEYVRDHEIPIYLGEFGAYQAADMDSRIRWTQFVAEEARRLGMTVAYWEFIASFGLYDANEDEWRMRLRDAVLPLILHFSFY